MIRISILFIVCYELLLLGKAEANNQDFEFVEDSIGKEKTKNGLVWILDPENELCGLLRCGDDGMCLLKDKFTAFCVDKAEAAKYGDKIISAKKSEEADDEEYYEEEYEVDDDDEEEYADDEEDYEDEDFEDDRSEEIPSTIKMDKRPFAKQCKTCPVIRPVFLCGSDNRTYSSLCRLHYHNCLHEASVKISCKGFCPCKDPNSHSLKKSRQRLRMKKYYDKLQTTLNDESTNARKEPESSLLNGRKVEKETDSKTLKDRKTHPFERMNSPKKRKNLKAKSRQKYSDKKSKYKSLKEHPTKYWETKKKNWQRSQDNDVTSKMSNSIWTVNECLEEELRAMGNRMLDWFSVIMSESRRRPVNPKPGPEWCKKEVSWMLSHLDENNDDSLSLNELYRLEHDDRERCIKPFLDRCDLNRDTLISSREWCKCFDDNDRPCAALKRNFNDFSGGYVPDCDTEGYYRPLQCYASSSMCWCVDKHGVEIKDSRMRGSPNCDLLKRKDSGAILRNRIDEDAENDYEETIVEGSAHMPLEI